MSHRKTRAQVGQKPTINHHQAAVDQSHLNPLHIHRPNRIHHEQAHRNHQHPPLQSRLHRRRPLRNRPFDRQAKERAKRETHVRRDDDRNRGRELDLGREITTEPATRAAATVLVERDATRGHLARRIVAAIALDRDPDPSRRMPENDTNNNHKIKLLRTYNYFSFCFFNTCLYYVIDCFNFKNKFYRLYKTLIYINIFLFFDSYK